MGATAVKTAKSVPSCDKRHGFFEATRHFKANRECGRQPAHLQTTVSTVHRGHGAGDEAGRQKGSVAADDKRAASHQVHNPFVYVNEDDKDKPDTVLSRLDAHRSPKERNIRERCVSLSDTATA